MAYLQITLDISEKNRAAAAAVYQKYKTPFLATIDGAVSKTLLIRAEDVQVLHGFKTAEQAEAYLNSSLFKADVEAASSFRHFFCQPDTNKFYTENGLASRDTLLTSSRPEPVTP